MIHQRDSVRLYNKILIVDDAEIARKLLHDMLIKKSYQTRMAASGQEALEIVSSWQPDLILLDVEMPGINGLETCRRLRTLKETQYVPIIFITAKETSTGAAVKGLEAGAVDYIRKPFDQEAVYARVDTHLRLYALNQQYEQEIILRKRAENLLKSFTKVLGRTATGSPLSEVLCMLIETGEGFNPEMHCSVQLLDKDSKHLQCCIAPTLPSYYKKTIEGIEINSEIGPCIGAYNGKRVIVEDVMNHSSWEKYRSLAECAKIRACWSEPIVTSSGNLLGTFEMYHQEPRCPDESDLDLIETLARLVGIVIEREQINQVKSDFFRNLSHELRTPLNAILGFPDLLLRSENLSGTGRRNIKNIQESANHLLKLIEDSLDLSKIERGAIELQQVDFDLRDLVSEGMRITFEHCFLEKGLRFYVKPHLDERVFVHGDQKRLRQILTNLLDNAAKFTEKGQATLTVTHPQKDRYYFEVKDTGPGISIEDQQHIFEVGYQGEVGKKKGGSGQGLSIVNKLVSLLGSELKFETYIGRGTRFFFELTLPAAKGEVAPREQREDAYYLESGFSVKALVVDDNEMGRELLTQMLRLVGVKVCEATNGRQALDQLSASGLPGIIFLNIKMPDLSGYEVLRLAQKQYPNETIKWVAISADEINEQDKKRFNAFLLKPIRREIVYHCIQKLLGVRFICGPLSGLAPAGLKNLASYGACLPELMYSNLLEAVRLRKKTEVKNMLAEIEEYGPKEKQLADECRTYLDQYALEQLFNELKKVNHE